MTFLIIAIVAPVAFAVVVAVVDYVEQKRYYEETYGFRPNDSDTKN